MRHVKSFFSKLKIVIHIIKINQSYYFHLSLIIFSVSYFIFIAYIWLLYIYHTITHWKKIYNIFSFKTYTTNKKVYISILPLSIQHIFYYLFSADQSWFRWTKKSCPVAIFIWLHATLITWNGYKWHGK